MNGEMNGNGRIAHFEEQVKAAEARLAAARMAQAKRKQKDNKKLFRLVGEEVCTAADKSPELHLMIAQILGGSVTDAAKRRFLDARRYIA